MLVDAHNGGTKMTDIEQQEDLRHDLERQMTIANEHVNEVDTLLREIETLRVEAMAERVNGYYIGFAKADEQSDVLKAAGDAIRGLLDITSDYNLDSEQAGRAYAALHDIGTALKKQSK